MLEMLSYPFILRALVVGTLVSLCSALLGVNLVLKRYSMIGDGLSHVAFSAMAVATVMNWAPLWVAIPVVIVASYVLLRLSSDGRFSGDSAIALLSTGALAVGIFIISMKSGINTDINNYMFGSVLAISKSDVSLSVILSLAVLALYVLFYNKIFAVTFDEPFAKATGVRADFYNMLVAVLTAVTIVLGMRMIGALLISSLIIFPAMSSMRVFKCFRNVVICSAVISVVCFLTGLMVSYAYSAPTGASVVILNIVVFAAFCAVSFVRGRIRRQRISAEN
ncbi:MAG: metal ABC transporter permease [Clostridia bacterium]|nr:metal ABC transporter permease [Clostridia bacterium]